VQLCIQWWIKGNGGLNGALKDVETDPGLNHHSKKEDPHQGTRAKSSDPFVREKPNFEEKIRLF